MKKYTFIIFVLLLCNCAGSLNAFDKESVWNSAVEAYSQEKYEEALAYFQAIEKEGYNSPELAYNIGNCYYKMENYISHAVLYYERALKLNPSYKDAQVNLQFAKALTIDRIEELPEFILTTWFKEIKHIFSSNAWAYITLGFLVLALSLLILFFYGKSTGVRKSSFIFSMISIFFGIITLIMSVSLKKDIISTEDAIVMMPVSSVRSSPGDAGKSVFILHEGTKVEIIEDLGKWVRVEIPDGRQGWIEKRDIESI